MEGAGPGAAADRDPQPAPGICAHLVRPCRRTGRRLCRHALQKAQVLMRYVSTRGQSPAVGFVDAVLAGLAPDGGLYVPEAWPQFTADEIAAFAGRPYYEVAAAVIGSFAEG